MAFVISFSVYACVCVCLCERESECMYMCMNFTFNKMLTHVIWDIIKKDAMNRKNNLNTLGNETKQTALLELGLLVGDYIITYINEIEDTGA